MKKSLLFFIVAAILLVSIAGIIAVASSAQSNIPLIPSSSLTEINPETGLPKSFETFKQISSNLSDEEKRKEYLNQDWTKLLAENKYISPVLFYTEKFFSFFNPLWRIILP